MKELYRKAPVFVVQNGARLNSLDVISYFEKRFEEEFGDYASQDLVGTQRIGLRNGGARPDYNHSVDLYFVGHTDERELVQGALVEVRIGRKCARKAGVADEMTLEELGDIVMDCVSTLS